MTLPANNNDRLVVFAICICLIAAAAFIRGRGLGRWCLAADEFYLGQAVSSIIETGLPKIKGGGYYLRGAGLTYLTAAIAPMVQTWETLIRLPALICGILTVPLFFLLGRLFIGTYPALICTTAVLFSSWHIEFSRFARFYAPFQFLFLAFIYCFLQGFYKDERWLRKLAWLIAWLSLVIHEGSIFIPVVFILPLLDCNRRDLKEKAVVVAGLLLLFSANYMVHKGFFKSFITSWTMPGASMYVPWLPEDWVRSVPAKGVNKFIYTPNTELMFRIVKEAGVWLISYFLLVLTGMCLGLRKIYEAHRSGKDLVTIATIGIMFVLPLTHQFGLLILMMTGLFIVRKDSRGYLLQHRTAWIVYTALVLMFFIAALFNFGFISASKNQLLHFLVGYPPFKQTVINPFRDSVPVYSLVVAVPFGLTIIYNALKRDVDMTCIFLAIIIIVIVVFSILKTQWQSTRYAYFLFPLILLSGYIGVYEIGKRIAMLSNQWFYRFRPITLPLTLVLLFFISEDFHIGHIINPAAPVYNFRMGEYDRYSSHWYHRVDIENPAQFVNQVYQDGDVVIIDHVLASQYLTVPFINYVTQEDRIRFPYHSRSLGTVEKWSGLRLLSNQEEFYEVVPTGGKHALWLVAATKPGYIGTSFHRAGHHPEEIAQKYNLQMQKVYIGIDNRVAVWQFRNIN